MTRVDDRRDASPGVVAVDAAGRLTHRTEDADRHLDDLAAEAPALTRLLRRHARRASAAASSSGAATRPAVMRARGRSGRWYALHAVVAAPGAWREASAVVVISPSSDAGDVDDATAADGSDAAAVSSLAERYGLSPRERGVLLRVARGESTKAAAAALGLSPFTVQDYVKRACDKVGVRTRRELVARLLIDG
ncbi:MAG TPA: helix-turn-helix transcriptional regulator [Gemmatimonadaceae bacterium]|nr:helix-turn-helix transcriptional regulator [Gemmatimonadaceae bacterium]